MESKRKYPRKLRLLLSMPPAETQTDEKKTKEPIAPRLWGIPPRIPIPVESKEWPLLKRSLIDRKFSKLPRVRWVRPSRMQISEQHMLKMMLGLNFHKSCEEQIPPPLESVLIRLIAFRGVSDIFTSFMDTSSMACVASAHSDFKHLKIIYQIPEALHIVQNCWKNSHEEVKIYNEEDQYLDDAMTVVGRFVYPIVAYWHLIKCGINWHQTLRVILRCIYIGKLDWIDFFSYWNVPRDTIAQAIQGEHKLVRCMCNPCWLSEHPSDIEESEEDYYREDHYPEEYDNWGFERD